MQTASDKGNIQTTEETPRYLIKTKQNKTKVGKLREWLSSKAIGWHAQGPQLNFQHQQKGRTKALNRWLSKSDI